MTIKEKIFNDSFRIDVNLDSLRYYMESRREISPMWMRESEKCIGCGNCTLTCPTCRCYDVKDLPKDIQKRLKSVSNVKPMEITYTKSGNRDVYAILTTSVFLTSSDLEKLMNVDMLLDIFVNNSGKLILSYN